MTNFENRIIHSRQSKILHLPLSNFSIYGNRFHYSCIEQVNKLPLEIKKMYFAGNPNKLKGTLSKILNTPSFYALEEFYNT